jgi:tRNA nucleotidyltransferase (CCA-adding enzyme)
MKIYLVGGSVRDRILGRVPRDTDYLVTDSSEEELLANGFVKVGQSFPIFLDPRTGDEYTLSVSVETDLLRRDLTINAMALDEEEKLIDPFGGKSDLDKKILRNVAREN